MTVYEQSIRAEVDIQITTAKRYPRDLERFMKNSIFSATHSEAAALKCGYTLPRKDKKIQGASVHLARILAQNFGNLRVAAKGLSISHEYVTAEAVCMDLENNVAVRVETRQKILDKYGHRFNEDMINITMLATIAKAERNAILHVIPASFVDEVYQAAQQRLIGDVREEKKLAETRLKAVKVFESTYGIDEKKLLEYFGKQRLDQLDAEDVVSMRGLFQALKDGDATVEGTFGNGANPDGESVQDLAEDFETETPPEEPAKAEPKKEEKPPKQAPKAAPEPKVSTTMNEQPLPGRPFPEPDEAEGEDDHITELFDERKARRGQ